MVVDSQLSADASNPVASWRQRVYPLGLLAGLALALIVLAVSANSSDAPAETVGGDFPAFYGAALIASDGDWEDLYDFDRQATAQTGLQADSGSVRFFAYPPQVALALAPLARFDYGWAYLAYTAVMLALLVATIRLAEPMIPWLRGRTALATVIALSFWPMLRAVTGGSNTALSLFIIVAAWRLVVMDRPGAAGLVLSLLLAKPQLAIPVIGLMLVIGLYRLVAGAAAGGIVFYVVGVPLAGWQWPREWWDVARNFGRLDAEVNGYSAVSWLGFLENALGIDSSVAAIVGWGLAGLTTLGLVVLWRRHGRSRLPDLLAIAMPGILLLSPHALSHDTAIILLTIAVLHNAGRLLPPLFGAVWLLGLASAWIRAIGFSPGFALLLLVAGYTMFALRLAGDPAPAIR